MARYEMTYAVGNSVKLRLESDDNEPNADAYMVFLTRCKNAIIELEEANPQYKGVGHARIEDEYTTREIW